MTTSPQQPDDALKAARIAALDADEAANKQEAKARALRRKATAKMRYYESLVAEAVQMTIEEV